MLLEEKKSPVCAINLGFAEIIKVLHTFYLYYINSDVLRERYGFWNFPNLFGQRIFFS